MLGAAAVLCVFAVIGVGVVVALFLRGPDRASTVEPVTATTTVVVHTATASLPAQSRRGSTRKHVARGIEGFYGWVVAASDLPGRSPRYVAENTGAFTMLLRQGRWQLTQLSPTAKHTTLVGAYALHGSEIEFRITGPTGDSQVGQSFSAMWRATAAGISLDSFSSPGWGGVLGVHPWRRQ